MSQINIFLFFITAIGLFSNSSYLIYISELGSTKQCLNNCFVGQIQWLSHSSFHDVQVCSSSSNAFEKRQENVRNVLSDIVQVHQQCVVEPMQVTKGPVTMGRKYGNGQSSDVTEALARKRKREKVQFHRGWPTSRAGAKASLPNPGGNRFEDTLFLRNGLCFLNGTNSCLPADVTKIEM